MNLGSFIVVDGPEGGGKSTQVKILVSRLAKEGVPVLSVREPGGTELSEGVRNMLLDVKYKNMPAPSELFLFLAARASLVQEVIKPALKNKMLVIADRFSPATYAYQAYGRKLPKKIVELANSLAVDEVAIDLYIKVMVDYDIGLTRKKNSGKLDRMELEEKQFHQRVYEGYNNFSPSVADCLEIDTTSKSIEVIHDEMYEGIKKRFPNFFSV
jgi:dTMP kinase